MRLALIQMTAKTDKKESLSAAWEYIRQASQEGADYIMLPEMFCCPYDNACFAPYAEPQGGMCCSSMAEAAAAANVTLIAGSMPEKDDVGHIFNTSYVFGPDGKLLARHRKAHLFDIDIKGGQYFRESDTLTPGSSSTVFHTQQGTFGLMICYDIRFPELSMRMALDGAQMIFVPACFNMTTGPRHWSLAFRARAVDNQVFMAGCSQARSPEGYIAYGHSIVTSPWGNILTEMDETAGISYTNIDLSQVHAVREQLPFLKQRRPDLY